MTTLNGYEYGSLFDKCVRATERTIKNVKKNVEHSLIDRFRSEFIEAESWFNYNLGADYEDEHIDGLSITLDTPEEAFSMLYDISAKYGIDHAIPAVSRDYDDIEDYATALLADALKVNGALIGDTSRIFDAEDITDAIILQINDESEIDDIMYSAEMTADDMIRTGSTALNDYNSGLFSNDVFVDLYNRAF